MSAKNERGFDDASKSSPHGTPVPQHLAAHGAGRNRKRRRYWQDGSWKIGDRRDHRLRRRRPVLPRQTQRLRLEGIAVARWTGRVRTGNGGGNNAGLWRVMIVPGRTGRLNKHRRITFNILLRLHYMGIRRQGFVRGGAIGRA